MGQGNVMSKREETKGSPPPPETSTSNWRENVTGTRGDSRNLREKENFFVLQMLLVFD